MDVIYLPSAQRDLVWFSEYYTLHFPQGGSRAASAFKNAEALLGSQPYAGPALEEPADLRVLRIPRTPFSLVYRVTPSRIEVLRVWDTRQQPTTF